MNQLERRLLDAFVRLQRLNSGSHAEPDSVSIEDAVALAAQGASDAEAFRPIADALIARGLLRQANAADRFLLTEDGRLAMAGPLDLTLYTRPGCHLCDELKEQIAPLLRRSGASLREVNIDADSALRALYDVDVPVLFLGARKIAKHKVDLRQLERQFAEADKGRRR